MKATNLSLLPIATEYGLKTRARCQPHRAESMDISWSLGSVRPN